jgi:hypothetical protein
MIRIKGPHHTEAYEAEIEIKRRHQKDGTFYTKEEYLKRRDVKVAAREVNAQRVSRKKVTLPKFNLEEE